MNDGVPIVDISVKIPAVRLAMAQAIDQAMFEQRTNVAKIVEKSMREMKLEDMVQYQIEQQLPKLVEAAVRDAFTYQMELHRRIKSVVIECVNNGCKSLDDGK
jgi:ribosomal protein S3AE